MKFIALEIPGVILVEPDVFKDDRGFFTETFHRKKYEDAGIPGLFVQDNYSHSRKHVLRGMHFQKGTPQGKLVYVIRGEVWDVAVDLRRGSPTYLKQVSATLSEHNHHQIYVPPGCAHGFVVMSETADVMYKCTELYSPKDDQGILWNDAQMAIRWPIANPVLSEKDAKNPRLAELPVDIHPTF